MTEAEIKEIRRENVRFLISDRFEGSQKKFADVVLCADNYISRILKGTKKLGPDLAESFETRLGLPRKSLDSPLADNPYTHMQENHPKRYVDPWRKRLLDTLPYLTDDEILSMVVEAEAAAFRNRLTLEPPPSRDKAA